MRVVPTKNARSRVPDGETRLSTVVDAELYKRVKIAAITNDLSVQAAVSEALELWLTKQGG